MGADAAAAEPVGADAAAAAATAAASGAAVGSDPAGLERALFGAAGDPAAVRPGAAVSDPAGPGGASAMEVGRRAPLVLSNTGPVLVIG